MDSVSEHHNIRTSSSSLAIDLHLFKRHETTDGVTLPHSCTLLQKQEDIVQSDVCGADTIEVLQTQNQLPGYSASISKDVHYSSTGSKKKARLKNKSGAADEDSFSGAGTTRTHLPSAPIYIPTRLMHSPLRTVQRPVHFLVASLGNPSPYQNTRHSAGHLLLRSLQSYLALPKLTKSKVYGGQVSFGKEVAKPQWTLFQSPSYMNTSGVPVVKAYREFLKEQATSSAEDTINGLVILYDEMELAPSSLKLRRGPTSAKGHNGIKSVQQSLQSAGLLDGLSKGSHGVGAGQPPDRFIKLAIGIGRPEGKTRDPDDISAYVLGQLTEQELHGIDALAGKVVSVLDSEMARLSSSQ